MRRRTKLPSWNYDTGISENSVLEVRRVRKYGCPELVEAISNDLVSGNAALWLAVLLTHDEQREIVADGPEAMRRKAESFREPVKEVPTHDENGVAVTKGKLYLQFARLTRTLGRHGG